MFLNKITKLSWLTLTAIFLLNKAVAHQSGETNTAIFDLLLAGGALPICSSLSTKNCTTNNFNSEDLSQLSYQFSAKKYKRFISSDFFKHLNTAQKENINSLLMHLKSEFNSEVLSKSQVARALKKSHLSALYFALSDKLYFALFDFFEVRQVNLKNERKKEAVEFVASKNQYSKQIFTTFYQQAQQRAQKKQKSKADIIIVTASSRDPFESADFYSNLFAHFDANVQWLPLDMNLWQAIETNRCDELELIRQSNDLFDRGRIYPHRAALQQKLCKQPEQLYALIQSADGLFFNGGDQSRTIKALTNRNGEANAVLKIIKGNIQADQLIIAGTSAGTAVQAGGKFSNKAIPMITNGDPELALKRGAFDASAPSARCSEVNNCNSQSIMPGELTYNSLGGSGLFNLGLLDTHFSERNREIRLASFAFSTSTRFGFGVDETTAVAVNIQSENVDMRVIGENGLFVIDTQIGKANLTANQINYVSGLSHYLNSGDRLSLNVNTQQLSIIFDDKSQPLTRQSKAQFPYNKAGAWRQNVSHKCGSQNTISWHKYDATFALKAADKTQFLINSKKQCSYSNLPFVVSSTPE